MSTGAVLVIGGGVAGIQAALDLADSGFKAYVVEKSPSIGGRMAQLDKTFPTNDCSMCILSPKMVEVGRNDNIELITNAEVEEISGSPGGYVIKVRKKPRYIDESKCTGCGSCAEACLLKGQFPNEFDEGIGRRGAAYMPFLQAVPMKYLIDPERCLYLTKGKCGKSPACADACEADAIDFEQKEEVILIDVGSIIITTGFEPVDISCLKEFGYGYDNVITALEFERILNASGPTQGEVIRPSDGSHPKKIAWVQCVGSRDKSTKKYCSSVCCTYATKEAIIAKEHAPELDCHIFYIDMRTYGKGFEEVYQRAQNEYGIKYHLGRITDVQEDPATGNILVGYDDIASGEIVDEEYDMLILSTGMKISESTLELAKTLGVELDENEFIKTGYTHPIETTGEGIFVAGVAENPKDIPESVAQASAAAGKASALLSGARGTLIKEKELPPETDVSGEEPRIGVFVCHCGINIGGVVDVPSVMEYASKLPNVVYADRNLYSCSEDAQEIIKNAIKEHNLNRVMVASCTPRTHEPLFRGTVREAGLNPYLFEMANIREHCSWVHMSEPGKATQKAKEVIRGVVAKAAMIEPLEEAEVPVEGSAMVIGGGVAGMTAALDIAAQGFPVHLVEREDQLGGMMRHLHTLINGDNPKKIAEEMASRVESNDNITIHTDTKIADIEGYVGNFDILLGKGEDTTKIRAGAIIVATGARELKPAQYGYGDNPDVITMLELEEKLAQGYESPDTVTFILCAGCRNEERAYCSRYCCTSAIKNALLLKKMRPETEVQVIHKDIRTYGDFEKYYNQALQEGVRFIRYDEAPTVTKDGVTKIIVQDIYSGEKLSQPSDLVVLVAPLIAHEDVERISRMLKVPVDSNGFFLEAHVKLRPVDFATDGVFLCGTAHGPKNIRESISQASGAAARACTILSKDLLRAEGSVSYVDEEICKGCGVCISVCPYNAITIEEGTEYFVAHINEALCKGCGTCASECPNRAIDLRHYRDAQLASQASAIIKEVSA